MSCQFVSFVCQFVSPVKKFLNLNIDSSDSSIDNVKKVTYVYLTGSEVVLYPLLSRNFLFTIVFIHHFNMVNSYLGYGRVQVFAGLRLSIIFGYGGVQALFTLLCHLFLPGTGVM